jgi:glycosyltransferase involved in cell wall biosynthesis
MSKRGRLCFFAPHLYPVTARGEVELVGGAEVIQWSLARGLAARGFDVSVVTCDYGQPARVVREGVALLRAFAPEAGVRPFRFLYPRLWKATSALWRARADVYVVQGSGIEAGIAYDVARLRRARFIFLAAHDFDALPSLPVLINRRQRWWYRRALYGASARVAQTEDQRRLFKDNFGLATQVVVNPADLPASCVDPGANGSILWLATYKPSKRPGWFTAVARALPDHRFVMVGGLTATPEGTESWESALRAADECENLRVHGFVPRERIGQFLEDAAVFVHTSPVEGFPMAVLEAWSYGIPTVTAVDPNGAVARFGLGAIATTIDEFIQALSNFMRDPEQRRAAGARAREYVERHHDEDAIYDEFASLFDSVINTSRHSTRPSFT